MTQEEHVRYSNGSTSTTTSSKKFEKDYVDSFNGFRQRGWRSIIRNKGNATTPASGNKNTFTDQIISGTCEIDASQVGQKVRRSVYGSLSAVFGDDLFPNPGSQLPPSEISNRALIAFLKKCKSAQRQLMVGVVAGELRETINLIKKPALGLRRLVDQYVGACRRRSRGLSPRATLQHISNQWLEYSFGMVPLISDIKGALKSAEKIYFDLPSKYVTHTERAPFNVYVDQVNGNLWSQYIPVRVNRFYHQRLIRKLCGEVRLMTTGSHGPIAETIGLTLPDFIPTVYELIPYSFLVDYFVNIGEVLEALSFNQVDLIWHSDTSKEDLTRTIEIVPSRPETLFGYPVSDYRVTPCMYTQEYSNFSRVSVPLGVPSFALKLPNTWSKGLNIAALASLRAL